MVTRKEAVERFLGCAIKELSRDRRIRDVRRARDGKGFTFSFHDIEIRTWDEASYSSVMKHGVTLKGYEFDVSSDLRKKLYETTRRAVLREDERMRKLGEKERLEGRRILEERLVCLLDILDDE